MIRLSLISKAFSIGSRRTVLSAARRVTNRLFESIGLLTSFPFMGHVGHNVGTYEWVVPRLPRGYPMSRSIKSMNCAARLS